MDALVFIIVIYLIFVCEPTLSDVFSSVDICMLADITGGVLLFCRVDLFLTSRQCQGLFERADADMD